MVAAPDIRVLDFDRDLAGFTPKQMEGIKSLDSGLIKYFLYGGALGGGKSYLLRWYALRRSMTFRSWGFTNIPIMLACETYPDLVDRQISKIGIEWPELGRHYEDHKLWRRCFIPHDRFGANPICFRNLDDPSKYASSEWATILVDELTKNPYETFTQLRHRLRWPGLPDVEAQFGAGTNPGGIGHGWVKQLWMDKDFPTEWLDPIDYRPMFAYLPSKADDNPHLTKDYWNMLNTLPPVLREAFRDGRWDVFIGQAFIEFSTVRHVLPQSIFPIPDNAPVYMTYDWGFGNPFSLQWWWVDNDGRVFLFDEWYGWSGSHEPGAAGLRLSDDRVALAFLAREEKQRQEGKGFSPNQLVARLAGRDCFQGRPDIRGGGQGPSTAEVFAKHGVYLTPGDDKDRLAKIKQFRNRIAVPEDPKQMPMLMVYPECRQFIRTIPTLVIDKNRIEDVDTKGEDHCYDAACHICMARPIHPQPPKKLKTPAQIHIDQITKRELTYDDQVILDHERAIAEIRRQDEPQSPYDDPTFYHTPQPDDRSYVTNDVD